MLIYIKKASFARFYFENDFFLIFRMTNIYIVVS